MQQSSFTGSIPKRHREGSVYSWGSHLPLLSNLLPIYHRVPGRRARFLRVLRRRYGLSVIPWRSEAVLLVKLCYLVYASKPSAFMKIKPEFHKLTECYFLMMYRITHRCVHVVVIFFTLTDRDLTIPSNIRDCQSGTWSAGHKKIRGRGTSIKLQ